MIGSQRRLEADQLLQQLANLLAVHGSEYVNAMGFGDFASKKQNRERNMVDYLDPNVQTMAKSFKAKGYATAHFGKWHMGGARCCGTLSASLASRVVGLI